MADSLIIFEGIPGRRAKLSQPLSKEVGMNRFLKALSITYRRDESTGRPRVNKDDSRLDRSQKESGNYYYLKNR